MAISATIIEKINDYVRFHLLPRLPGRRCFFMDVKNRDLKKEQEEKVRCVNYLLQLLIKYGPDVLAEEQKKQADNE